jgi:amidase
MSLPTSPAATASFVAVPQVPPPADPVGWPAWRLSDAVASGELDAVELVTAHLDRLSAVEPALTATTYICSDEAREDAAALGRHLAAGGLPGPLCGVPFTVKDIIATAGVPTCLGSAAFATNIPRRDAATVARLRAAGAILIAKTNCPEFGFGVACGNERYGQTRNPWGAHSSGGSSGGEAALVAAGASALGLGTDYGGSLRWPAACCGVVAMRPGLGTVDGSGQLPERDGRLDGDASAPAEADSPQRRFQVVGPIARSIRDLEIAYAVISGLVAPPPSPPRAAFVFAAMRDLDNGPIGADALGAVDLAIGALRDAGYSVEEPTGVLDGLHGAYNALRQTDHLADLRIALRGRGDLIGAEAAAVLEAAPASALPREVVAHRQLAVDRLRAVVLERLRRTPVLLLPVAPLPACDFAGNAQLDERTLRGFELMSYCRAVSALGFPALSVPVGLTKTGLPISVQVVTGPGQEPLALACGSLLERLLGGSRTPPWLSPTPIGTPRPGELRCRIQRLN